MVHCTNSTDALVTLESMESCKISRIRNHQRILAVSKEHGCKGVPFVQYHRNCQSVFSMKRDLEKIKKSESKVRVLLGHTVLHNNPTVLHDVNT